MASVSFFKCNRGPMQSSCPGPRQDLHLHRGSGLGESWIPRGLRRKMATNWFRSQNLIFTLRNFLSGPEAGGGGGGGVVPFSHCSTGLCPQPHADRCWLVSQGSPGRHRGRCAAGLVGSAIFAWVRPCWRRPHTPAETYINGGTNSPRERPVKTLRPPSPRQQKAGLQREGEGGLR